MAVDSLGLMHALLVVPANVQDRVGGPTLMDRLHESTKRVKRVYGDSHFDTAITHAWVKWGWPGEVVTRAAVQPKRWIVERTFGWLNRYRRLAKDVERTEESSAGFVTLALIRLMTLRLAPA
jgi:putative transposase